MSAPAGAAVATGLRIEKLVVERGGRPILREVSLDIAPGEVTALLGPNGTGKSTLVLAVAGTLRPTSGRVLLGEQDLARRRPEVIRRAGVAVVPEGRRLLHDLTVAENLRVATYALNREEAASGIDYVLDLFPELKPRWDVTGRSLSGGQQQMVVLAQALASRPSVLLVDELSLGLAPLVVKQIFAAFGEIRTRGVTFVLVEQNARQALGIADRAYVLETGEITRSGPATRMLGDETIKRAYLGGNVAV